MVPMDLSKPMTALPHDLMLAKLEVYGFGLESLNLMHSYRTNRLKSVKARCTYSTWQQMKSDVPQGSLLGPLQFTLVINDFACVIEN